MSGISDQVYNRILLFVLGIPVFFLLLFTVVSMTQLREINSRIESGKSQALKEMIQCETSRDSLMTDAHRQFLALAVLEEESLGERYRQGHYSLVSRSFKQFLGFFTGIIMVIVGCVFVLLKLREKIDLTGSKSENLKLALVTNSPGVAFGMIGAILIGITSTSNDKITVRDSGLYLTREFLVAPYFSEKGAQLDWSEFLNNNEGEKDTNEEEDGDSANNNEVKIVHPPSSKKSKDAKNLLDKEE